MTVTESFPSWYIMRNPNKRVITTAYSDKLARKFGQRNKEKINEYGKELFDVSLKRDKSSKANWELDGSQGGMISSGITGGITGEGANLMIIDDPFKNREQADSPTYRDKVWAEWQDTLSTRLSPDGAVILIMTRWHHDDLAGRLLKKESEKWDVVKLPAEAEGKDLLDRDIGEPLWPSFGFDKEWLDEKKEEVGSRTWNALYQQRPSAQQGDIFKREWWNYYETVPKQLDEVVQSWDTNFKGKQGTSYCVGQVWAKKGANKYLIDQYRDRMDFPELIRAIQRLTNKYPDANAKLIEEKANGSAVIQTLRDKVSGLIAVNPDSSKESRANSISPQIEAGNVYLPQPQLHTWVEGFIEEHANFPNGEYDDQVDCCTQALDRLEDSSGSSLVGMFS